MVPPEQWLSFIFLGRPSLTGDTARVSFNGGSERVQHSMMPTGAARRVSGDGNSSCSSSSSNPRDASIATTGRRTRRELEMMAASGGAGAGVGIAEGSMKKSKHELTIVHVRQGAFAPSQKQAKLERKVQILQQQIAIAERMGLSDSNINAKRQQLFDALNSQMEELND